MTGNHREKLGEGVVATRHVCSYMEDINKNKPRIRARSIDGISRPTGHESSSGSLAFDTSRRDAALRPTLDDFKRSEGYRPTAGTLGSPGGGAAATTKSRPKRRSLFGRRRRGLDSLHTDKRRRFSTVSRRKKVLRVSLVLLLIILLMGGFLFAKGYINFRKIFSGGGGAAALQENVDPSKLRGEGDGRINILVLGRGGPGHEGPDLTDTIILVSIDPISKEAALVSLPRDLYVRVPGQGSMKINAAYALGKEEVLNNASKQTPEVRKKAEEAGFKTIEATIQNTLGLPVHYHAIIDFAGFEKAIDTVGGIDLKAPGPVVEQMRIDRRNYQLNVQPGQQHFDGFRALAYARSRHTSPRGDFDRAERQRLMVIALKAKIFSAGTYSNPAKVSRLFSAFGDHIQTNFSPQDLSRLYDLSKGIPQAKITSIGLVDPPHDFLTTANVGGLSVVVPKAGINNYQQVQSYLRNTLRDSFLKSENASILVLNGTETAGLATTKAEELKSFGYRITKVDNAPTKNYPKTILVDRRGGTKKYTQHYLEKRFKTTTVTKVPDAQILPGTADFVILIGNDQTAQ